MDGDMFVKVVGISKTQMSLAEVWDMEAHIPIEHDILTLTKQFNLILIMSIVMGMKATYLNVIFQRRSHIAAITIMST